MGALTSDRWGINQYMSHPAVNFDLSIPSPRHLELGHLNLIETDGRFSNKGRVRILPALLAHDYLPFATNPFSATLSPASNQNSSI